MYCVVMEEEGKKQGINFKFGGEISNTFEGHRLIQWVQEEWSGGGGNGSGVSEPHARREEAADKVVKSLYRQYFEEEKTPSAENTLLEAAKEAGIDDAEARRVVVEEKSEWALDTKMAIREQVGNGVDSVPYIVFEGKRRDLTAVGAKEVEEYLKLMEMIAKESY